MVLVVALLLAFSQSQSSTSPLRIVVLEGEDAVNVVQQKTAVRPVVEVRDRNNLPVAGVTVTFAIQGNAATFAGGAPTFSVVTNAAGQAAAATLQPVASGALQIQVQAALQGQTAIATITQTNVLTAAQAAAAAGGSGSAGSAGGVGTGGGSGGGVSGAAIGGVAGAAGAATAIIVASGDKEQPAAPPVTISVGPVSGGIRDVTEFTFTASGGAGGGNYSWDFGDGTTAAGLTVRHIFSREGQFTITARDGQAGSATASVPVGSLTGTFVTTWTHGRFIMNMTQTGATLRGQFIVDVTVPGTSFRNDTSPLDGTLSSPLNISANQRGECLRRIDGTASPTLSALTALLAPDNPACPTSFTHMFSRQ